MKPIKMIINIAKTELKTLFFSPIAWLVLAIFAIQANMTFIEIFADFVKYKLAGYHSDNITGDLFTADNWRKGVFPNVQQYLYLYIPLLTMGLMSREISSGSIKLLFSSPVSSRQIVFGKFLSMMVYGLVLIGALLIPVIFSAFAVKDLDIPYLLSGLLGIYLLLSAYSAIGLFMSSLTSYQVVAAIGTLGLLAVLNYVGGVGQGIDFVRDITYWLSISGRAKEMVGGLISSEDVLYFIVVISMFLSFTIVKFQSGKIKRRSVIIGRYLAIVFVGLIIGYLSSRPSLKFYSDLTATHHRTLTPNSQKIIDRLDGNLTITTFVNILDAKYYYGMPRQLNEDIERFQQYTRFKPEIKMKYVYYWDKANNPRLYKRYPNMTDEQIAKKLCSAYEYDFKDFLRPEEIRKIVDLSGEENRFVRLIERENGEKTFLRVYDDMYVHPFESEISAALKGMVIDKPKVGFLTGHGERDILKKGDRDYSMAAYSKTFRNSLVNQGFDIASINIADKEIPKDISILVVADLKSDLTDIELARLEKYISEGGNLIIGAEPRRRKEMKPLVEKLGVKFVDGIMIQKSEAFSPTLVVNNVTKEAPEKISYLFKNMVRRKKKVTMSEALALDCSCATEKGFEVCPILTTNKKGCWNEKETTDFVDGEVVLNKKIGEVEKSNIMAVGLSRNQVGKNQRIVVLGDADCLSNSEISLRRNGIDASNFTFFTGLFEWLSEGEVPIDTRRPKFEDNDVYVGKVSMKFWSVFFLWLIPIGIIVSCLRIWLIRRKK